MSKDKDVLEHKFSDEKECFDKEMNKIGDENFDDEEEDVTFDNEDEDLDFD